jgi:hypothetical protein
VFCFAGANATSRRAGSPIAATATISGKASLAEAGSGAIVVLA